MILNEIDDNELYEYINSMTQNTELGKSIEWNEKLKKKIASTKEIIKKISDKNTAIEQYVDAKNIRAAGEECLAVFPLLNRISNNTNYVLNGVGYKAKDSEVLKTKAVETVFSEENGILHIVFGELLPGRPKQLNNKIIAGYKQIHDRYKQPFIEYFKDGKHKVNEEKVVLCFIHHFSDERLIKDHDNFDTKFIIDMIAINVLTDDSAKYCDHYMSYVMDTKEFSEIYVIPESKYIDFLQKKETK